MMTHEELAEIRARADAATPGPWEWKPPELMRLAAPGMAFRYAHSILHENDELEDSRCEDREFIAHSREDIPRLLAEVERLRDGLDENGCNTRRYEERKRMAAYGDEIRQRTIDEIVAWLRRVAVDEADPAYPWGADEANELAGRIEAGEPWRQPDSGSGSSVRA